MRAGKTSGSTGFLAGTAALSRSAQPEPMRLISDEERARRNRRNKLARRSRKANRS